MDNIAGKVMLSAGIRRYFLAILAGIIGSFSMPSGDFLIAAFVSFTLLVWLLDGISSIRGRTVSINGVGSSFLVGWLFGVGYFLTGFWWIRAGIIELTSTFLPFLGGVLFFVSFPIFLAIFYGIATSIASLLWSEGMGRICILACAFGLCEWLRSFLGTSTWNAIGYAAMPIPIMMQSVHWIGLFGMNALSVFCFASPALFGTRRDVKIGMTISSVLLVLHIAYGVWIIAEDSKPSLHFSQKWPVVRIVQPGVNPIVKESDENILGRYLSLTALPVSAGEAEPSVIIWAGLAPPFSIVNQPKILKRIASTLKEKQILIFGSIWKDLSVREDCFYRSVYVIDSNGSILTSSNATHFFPFAEYLPYRNIFKKLHFDFSLFPKDYVVSQSSSVLVLSEKLRFYPLIFSDVFFRQDINKSVGSANAILNIIDDSWFMNNKRGFDQSFRYAQIQAVEIGLPLIRVANNGISAFLDNRGRIISSLQVGRSASIDMYFQPKVQKKFNYEIQMTIFWIVELILLMLAIIA
ncbi:Apolipoprotein N-acyltransferase [Candidatus Liberibacter solanacearum]|uniref:apolipoprotein N-acyltransferase n=1 Tax=Candidatus Liberibacter solanacearum TaxID=556287 RepID=UPI0038726FE4